MNDAIAMVVLLFYLAVIILTIASLWQIYVKADKPGWASIVPIYNLIVLLEIVGKPAWWIILFLIPLVNLVFVIIVVAELAKSFGKGVGFTLGMIFLGFIFYPILAFGDAEYLGPGGEGQPRRRKKRRRDDYDDEDDRPRRRLSARRDNDDFDEDEEDRPRRRLAATDDDEFDDVRSPNTAIKTPPMPPPLPVTTSPSESSIVECSSCGRKLKVPATAIGKKVKCPSCGTAFTA